MAPLDFLEPLEDLIVEHFEVLAESYARDLAEEVVASLSGILRSEYGVRYAVVDSTGTQLENVSIFREHRDALDYLQERNLPGFSVATLIFER